MSYQKYDEIRKERDQLRAELEEAKRHHEVSLGEIKHQRALVESAVRQRDAARADNEALRARLGDKQRELDTMTAMWNDLRSFIADVREVHPTINEQIEGRREIRRQAAKRMASGSSTGEAKCVDCDGSGIAPSNPILSDGRECGSCDGTGVEPAAPEPAPAACGKLIGSLNALCTKPRNHGGDCEHDARKASDSSTGEAPVDPRLAELCGLNDGHVTGCPKYTPPHGPGDRCAYVFVPGPCNERRDLHSDGRYGHAFVEPTTNEAGPPDNEPPNAPGTRWERIGGVRTLRAVGPTMAEIAQAMRDGTFAEKVGLKPAAPEPAPAPCPAWCGKELPPDGVPGYGFLIAVGPWPPAVGERFKLGRASFVSRAMMLGWCSHECREREIARQGLAAAPASAQVTTEHDVAMGAIDDLRDWTEAQLEALDKRVAALEEWSASPFWQMGTPKPKPVLANIVTEPLDRETLKDRREKINPTPRWPEDEAAPIERHVFVCQWVRRHGAHTLDRHCANDCRCDVLNCGQPRSAAIHGEGGK